MIGPAPQQFSIIGAGRAGSALARALRRAGWELVSVLASTPDRSRRAREALGAREAAPDLASASRAAPLTVLALPDRLLTPVATDLGRSGARAGEADGPPCLLHLSGALTSEAIAAARTGGFSIAACHPLVSLSDPPAVTGNPFQGVTFAVDGDEAAATAATELAITVGGRPFAARPAGKIRYHAGAAIASNALVALASLAARLMADVGLGRERAVEALLPLLRSTLDNLEAGPEAALTGPVRRGDATTVRAHLEALRPGDEREAYRRLARLTLEVARQAGLQEPLAASVDAVLAAD